MKVHVLSSLALLFIIAGMVLSSCAMPGATPAATVIPPPTNTPKAKPTSTPKPTITHTPTATPNLTATQQVDDFNAQVKEYYDAKYVSTTDGTYSRLSDTSQSWAEGQYYNWWDAEPFVHNFILKTDIAWSSATESANAVSGCGFVFNLQGTGDKATRYVIFISVEGYIIFWDKSRQIGTAYYGPGKKTGSAHLTLIAEKDLFRVFVNNKSIKTFSIKGAGGGLAYTVISGTNKSYGTKCDFTNTELWKIQLP